MSKVWQEIWITCLKQIVEIDLSLYLVRDKVLIVVD